MNERGREKLMDIRVEKGKPEKYSCELLLLFAFESPELWKGPIRDVDLGVERIYLSLDQTGGF